MKATDWAHETSSAESQKPAARHQPALLRLLSSAGGFLRVPPPAPRTLLRLDSRASPTRAAGDRISCGDPVTRQLDDRSERDLKAGRKIDGAERQLKCAERFSYLLRLVSRKARGSAAPSSLQIEPAPLRRVVAALAVTAKRSVMRVDAPMAAVTVSRQLERWRRLGLVAILASGLLMRACQRKLGLASVVETPAGPSIRIMAGRATATEPPLMEVLVALFAGHGRVLVTRRTMTLLTGDLRVQSDQRKTREIVVERDALAPVDLSMTGLAPWAELSAMGIVLAMAGNAACCELVLVQRSGVASIAFDLGMSATQRILRLVVIEAPTRPSELIVARLAARAVAIRMHVLQAMTRDTARPHVLVDLAGMAGRARDFCMRSLQCETGPVVIERLGVAPFDHAVAIVAGFAEPPTVRIRLLVTFETDRRRLAEFHLLEMAARAWHISMRIDQPIVGEIVIERFPVKLRDVELTSLVI